MVNRLADETSPYLRQHAHNPVEWYPWGEEAWERARREDKPVFLSIGYASCHWCHVMAHESFEDPAAAADLATWFVSIKVDREERPDVDAVYMAATQAVTGSGGWPMSVFCTPDGRPFYAGTYFPPTERHGMPSFRRVVHSLGEAWLTERAQVQSQADALVAAISRELRLAEVLAEEDAARGGARGGAGARTGMGAAGTGQDELDPATLRGQVVAGLADGFDPEWGGFGPAPKFPRPTLVEACLLQARHDGNDAPSRPMVLRTLDAMAAGGIHDHLVGGFCRYATDRRWLVPHFEKMLTDQALLARAYLHAWQETGHRDYLGVVTDTLDWVLGTLVTAEGALASSLDADADGVEGGHATFTFEQLGQLLPAELVAPAAEWYGITPEGNWEGRSIPVRPVGAPLERPADVEEARRLLAAARAERAQPARDDKVLTEWNAMAAATLAEVASATGNAHYGQRAEEIAEFLWTAMHHDGRLMRSWQGGRARHRAVAADYAWLVEACVRLSEWTGRARWRHRALTAVEQLLELFWDEGAGGFFSTGRDAEALVVRPKEYLDGAVPAANSIALRALLRAGALTDDPRISEAVERTISSARPLLRRHPGALPTWWRLWRSTEAPRWSSPASGPISWPRSVVAGCPALPSSGGSGTTVPSSPVAPTIRPRPTCAGPAWCDRPTAEVAALASQLDGLERSSSAGGRS